MSGDLGAYAEQQLANMSSDEVDSLLQRVRPPSEPTDPKERATQALRRELGIESRGKATKERAAEALRTFKR